jgi:hypothetical protein
MEITIGSEHSLTSAERRISTTSSWNRRFSRLFPLCSVLITALLLYSCGSTKYLYTPFTLPAGTIEVTFSVTADMRHYTGENINYFRNACEQIAFGGAGDFMVSPGDIDPPDNTYATIQKYIDPTYLWYPVAGNHETETASDMVWLRIFNRDGNTLPNIVNVGPAGCAETTYSFDYGNAHFVVLNEYFDGSSDVGTDGDVVESLRAWLEDDLSYYGKPITFVFGHEPAFPQPDADNGRIRHSGDSLDKYPGNRDAFWNTLAAYNVTAYICGHTHNYSTYKQDGVWQIDVGHARGIGDMGAMSTLVMLYVMESGEVWFYTYRLNLDENRWELADFNQLR